MARTTLRRRLDIRRWPALILAPPLRRASKPGILLDLSCFCFFVFWLSPTLQRLLAAFFLSSMHTLLGEWKWRGGVGIPALVRRCITLSNRRRLVAIGKPGIKALLRRGEHVWRISYNQHWTSTWGLKANEQKISSAMKTKSQVGFIRDSFVPITMAPILTQASNN